jgi:hypothetical protein
MRKGAATCPRVPYKVQSDSGEDSQDEEWQQTQRSSEDGRTGPPAAIAAAPAAGMAAAAAEAATSATVIAAAARKVQPGEQTSGRPRPHPKQTAYSQTQRRQTEHIAKQNRPGPPQAIAPDAVTAQPPPLPHRRTEGPTGKR